MLVDAIVGRLGYMFLTMLLFLVLDPPSRVTSR